MLDLREYQKKQASDGSQTPYAVQLLLKEPAAIEADALLEELKKNLGNVEPVHPESGLLAFAHNDYTTQFQEGMIPVQCVFTPAEAITNPTELVQASINQTWDWPEAKEVISGCKAVVSVTDLFADRLNRQIRLQVFHGAMKAILKVRPVEAIHWLPSQRMVNPELYVKDLSEGALLFSAPVNVRMFRIENSEERIMDTMGLGAFGLPDVQCHFQNVNPTEIASLLYNYADYIFQKGDVIRDGDTIQVQPSDHWKCQHEMSMIEPSRIVVDVHPGKNSPPRDLPAPSLPQ